MGFKKPGPTTMPEIQGRPIYLAGKAFSQCKADIISAFQGELYDDYYFSASDLEDRNSHYVEFRKKNALLAKALLDKCEFLIAVLDRANSYGSIAEIAYAVALGKPCFVWVHNLTEMIEIDDGNHGTYEVEGRSPSIDAYMFVANLVNPGCIEIYNSGHGQLFYNDTCEACNDFEAGSICWSSDANDYLRFVEKSLRTMGVLNDPMEKVGMIDKCQSPIERSFYTAAYSLGLRPIPQYSVGSYRLDFAFPIAKIAVELDGHEWHKTKEQRTNDAQRQRWLELNGWRVIRFTGSEIHRNVNHCVQQTNTFLKQISNQHGSPVSSGS